MIHIERFRCIINIEKKKSHREEPKRRIKYISRIDDTTSPFLQMLPRKSVHSSLDEEDHDREEGRKQTNHRWTQAKCTPYH